MSVIRAFTLRTIGDPSGWAEFYAGRTADGRQLLVGWGGPERCVVFLWFDTEGSFLDVESWDVPGSGNLSGITYTDFMVPLLLRRFAALGFRSEPIKVAKFDLDDPFDIAACRTPNLLEQYLNRVGDEKDEDERKGLAEQIDTWICNGTFELVWGYKRYYINQDGTLDRHIST